MLLRIARCKLKQKESTTKEDREVKYFAKKSRGCTRSTFTERSKLQFGGERKMRTKRFGEKRQTGVMAGRRPAAAQ